MRRLLAALVLCLLHIPVRAEDCVASVYSVGDSSQPGTKTASGTPLNDNAMTAAHKSPALWFQSQGHQQEECYAPTNDGSDSAFAEKVRAQPFSTTPWITGRARGGGNGRPA